MSAALVVMAKEPLPGRAKTRLCPPLEHAQAAALAEAALADTLAAVSWTPAKRRVVVLDGAPGRVAAARLRGHRPARRGPRASGWRTRRADVGEALLFVGMDTPQLTRALLCGALDRLAEPGVDAVLGPTTDGGYWTIGLREPDPRVFDGVPMSTDATAAAQRARLDALGLRTSELDALRDVDTYDDAVAVAALAPWSRFAATFELHHRLTSRVAVAFQLAVTVTPGARCSPPTAAPVISATSGCGAASPTRTRLPIAVTVSTSACRWFCAEPSGVRVRGLERDVPRVHAQRDRPGPAVGARRAAAAVQRDDRQAAGPLARDAGQHDRAGEVRDERRRGRRGELAGRALLHDPAGVDDRDAVAEHRGLGEVVRHEQRRDGGVAQHGRELARRARARAGVERRQRLVEQQRARRHRQRAGERDALALAARQRPRPRGRELLDAEAREQLVGAPAALGARQAAQAVGDVLPDLHVAEQRVVLKDVAAAAQLGRDVAPARRVEPHLVAPRHPPARGPQQPGGDPQQRALARARRPGDRQAAAGRRLDGGVELEGPERRAGLNAQHRRPAIRRRASR